jgi:N-acetylmuramoyl-L-alanine amidase
MLAIWGVTAIAGAVHGGLTPEPKLSRSATRIPTRTAETTKPADEPTMAAAPKPKPIPAPKPAAPAPVAPKATPVKYTVVIDPGHGGELSGNEPTGPHDSTPHPKTASGADGEAAVVLKVGLKLRPLLEAQGVHVIMTRTTAGAAVSNIQRAQIANNAHADLFLRLHCDGIYDSSVHGISMQVPGASNEWAPIGPSRKAGEIILSSLVRATGAADKGVAPRSDLAGFNWSKVPTCLPEMGFLSNGAEAAKLKSDSYENTLARALADGTMQYLHTLR